MAKLPYSRVVNVSLTRNQNFASRRGFGTLLFLTSQEVTGELDATHRTKLYASLDEVAADFATSDEFYKAATIAFSQNPRPLQIKAGFYDLDSTPVKAEFIAELNTIYDADNDFYFITVEASLRDTAIVQGLVEWVETKPKMAFIDSNDVDTQAVNTNSIAGLNKGLYERTAIFYHTDATQYQAVAAAAVASVFNFDQADQAYTLKFKELAGIAPIDLTSAKVTAISGFVPEIGQATGSGNMANTYVNIGGQNFALEGSTLKANVFIDEVHATDWIVARTEEEMLSILLNNKRVPFTNEGMEQLASAARSVMNTARRAGLIAEDINPETGDYEASIEYTIPDVFDVPESQRKARIAPEISVAFRYAGAVHYGVVKYQMRF